MTMKIRPIAVFAVLALAVIACDGDDPELTTDSTIVTGGTNAPATTTTTEAPDDGNGGSSPSTTLVGQTVTDFEVVARFPNDNGEERYYVIPEGAYTDVDLTQFVIELLENDSELYGAEIFDSVEAAEAYQVEEGERTEEQVTLIESDHFVTLIGRDRIEFHGPFSEFPGGAIGS
ncbi:MAG TPA: hypothetical protein VFZ80_01345 [Acidimicrobiia bacterium]